MATQITQDLTLKEACNLLRVTPQTFIRWATIGVDGKKLKAFKLGGRWFTSTEAIEEFKTYPGFESEG